jgi:HemY protein
VIRAVPALLVVIVLIAVAVFVADRPGTVELQWQGWEIDTSVAVLVLGMAFLGGLAAAAFHLLRKFVMSPFAFMRWRRERRREAGFRALTQGMVAIAAGDADEAQRFARRADVLLAEPPLTLLLSAQAAQLNGDQDAARRYFSAMLERKETEFLGLRGLLMQALHAGDQETALRLVARAKELRPRTPWVLDRLYRLEARAGKWPEADATLAAAIARKAVDGATGQRHRAILLNEESRAAKAAGDPGRALTLAEKAVAADRGFAPAAIRLAELQTANARPRRAIRTLLQAWRTAPQPAIAEAYGALFKDETPTQRVKRFQSLAAANPGHVESSLVEAEAALKAKLWGEARRHLLAAGAATANPSPRLCRLMAEVETGERRDEAAAHEWLGRAARAPVSDPVYVCEACGAETSQWSALCPECHEFGSLVWKAPPRHGLAPPSQGAAPAQLIDIERPRIAGPR